MKTVLDHRATIEAFLMARVLAAVATAALLVPIAHAQEVLQDFENGQGGWFADNGVWEVGTPANVGPTACSQGNQCAGTVIDDHYRPLTSSRLVSPPVLLGTGTPQDPLNLSFFHWFQWHGGNGGVVQVSVYDEVTSQWSDWIDAGTTFSGSSGAWTLNLVDLTSFSDELVRIGFFHMAVEASCCTAGWYVDEIAITERAIFSDGFESSDT